MLKKTISYTDYNGVPQTEDVYFNLTKAELMKLQVRENGKYLDRVKDLVEEKQTEGIFDFFYNVVLDAYGEKSEDGKRFYKTQKIREDFESSITFSEILSDLLGDMPKMAEFTVRVLPPDFQDNAEKSMAEYVKENGLDVPALPPVD